MTSEWPPLLAGWGLEQMDEVERLIRRVNDTVVLPLHGRLSVRDVSEKGPGDLVTVADSRAEEALRQELVDLVPGSAVVGEEGVSRDPHTLGRLGGAGPVWIVDPIDGTENFVAGRPHFSTLVALAYGGELLASWLHAPLLRLSANALAGGGTTVNGRRVHLRGATPGRPVPAVALSRRRWWGARTQEWDRALRRADMRVESFDTAGLGYAELLRGTRHALVLEWEHVWDHAAGVLLLREAGGAVVGVDGRDFQLSGGNALPMVAAVSEATAHDIQRVLRGGSAPLGSVGQPQPT